MPRYLSWLCAFLVVTLAVPALAGEIAANQARISFLTGNAVLERPSEPTSRALKTGDTLLAGDMVTTGRKSRLEISLPDGSIARFDENATFTLNALQYEPKVKRSIKIRVTLGKMWAKVAKLTGISGGFDVSARTMTAGVRGTVYRLNVNKDDSVLVKVYWGEVLVKSKPAGQETAPAAAKPATPAVGPPTAVSGPEPVAGPAKVTMTEWTAILKGMQQLSVHPDGTLGSPYTFDPIQDRDVWVRWNQERDKGP